MEGIAGTYGSEDRNIVGDMLARLRHRGPDGQSIHIDDGAVLGATGKTPSSGRAVDALVENDSVVVASDSYLFNREELRKSFAPDDDPELSDRELLLEMYSQLGTDLFGYLNGAYAVAIVDGRKTILA